MKNADMPAMPMADRMIPEEGAAIEVVGYYGLTKREQFCLKMGVPETGDKELDDIIRKGNKQKFTAMAMQGLLSSGYNLRALKEDVVEKSIEYADALLKELDK